MTLSLAPLTDTDEPAAEADVMPVASDVAPVASDAASAETPAPAAVKSLDALLVDALGSEATDRDTLVSLWQRTVDAIAAAKATIEVESARTLDLSNSNPGASDEAVRVAHRTIDRLGKAIYLIKARVDALDADIYAQTWHAQANEIGAQRDALAQELAELYPSFVAKLAGVFARIDENKAAIANLHAQAPRGEPRRLIDAELAARGLERYTAEQPPLRDNLKLPRFDRPVDIAYPVPPALNPFAVAMGEHFRALDAKSAGMFGPDWHEAQKIDEDLKREELARRAAQEASQAAERKREFERSVSEQDRRARMGIRG